VHHHLGHVFISHTAVDKPFVRQLAERLRSEGFQIWLDERDLMPGDALAQRISEALLSARVVLVVVSRASIASMWLRYELNLATDRMIKGQCRVIPIVIDDAPLPAEVRALLYADCRTSFDEGIPSILTALKHESRQAAVQHSFWSRADTLIREVFGGTGSASLGGEYQPRDYELVFLPLEDDSGNEDTAVFFEVVSNYMAEPVPLTEAWFDDYRKKTEDIPEDLSLIVSERPTGFSIDVTHPDNARAGVRRLQWEWNGDTFTSRQIVVADLSGLKNEGDQSAVLAAARQMLIECATFLLQERRVNRERRQLAG
jgi:hypothetical protein